jgi:Flp pilus assembly protein TadG
MKMKFIHDKQRSFLREESGQTAILAAACLVGIISFLGIAIDLGNLRYQQRRLQSAADAAALAAGLEFSACGTVNNCAAMQQAAQTSVVENAYTGATFVKNCAAMPTSGTVLMLNNPVCLHGASDPNATNRNYVEVVMKRYQPTYFAKIFGFSTIPISARAEATRAPAPCIYALDKTGINAISVDVLAVVNAKCAIIDESNSPWAFGCNVLAGVAATSIHITGGLQGLLCTGGVSPAPETSAPIPTPADPLAYLPKPAIPNTCTGNPTLGLLTLQILGNATLYPGRYCGGIVIGPLAHVTFMPGVYVLTPTGLNLLGLSIPLLGGLTITAGAVVNGTGVTFYNAGPSNSLTGGISFVANTNALGIINSISNVVLKAPTTGTYAGILFMQDPLNTSPATIVASILGGVQLEGAFYFPTASVNYLVAGNSRFNILVAKDIDFLALSAGLTSYEADVFGNDYSQLPGGVSPIPPTGAVLVQ